MELVDLEPPAWNLKDSERCSKCSGEKEPRAKDHTADETRLADLITRERSLNGRACLSCSSLGCLVDQLIKLVVLVIMH